MLNRREHAHTIARLIEQVEHCPVLTNESIDNIERALTDYAAERLTDIRSAVVNMTLSAVVKTRLVAAIDRAIHFEVSQ